MTAKTPQPRLRITARGRAVLTALIALPVVLAAFAAISGATSAVATDAASSTSFTYVQVEAGQSLWELAGEIDPTADPRDVVSDLVHLNQLQGATVQPGQRLAVPASYID